MCVYMYVRDDDGVKVKVARPPTKKGCRGQEKLAAFRFFFPKGRGGRRVNLEGSGTSPAFFVRAQAVCESL